MSYDPDALLDRRRLKRRLRLWQGVAILAALGAVLALLHASGELILGERIARIHIDGVIVTDEERDRTLKHIAADDSVRGLVVHIDSPGGSVVGGEDLYKALREVSAIKPVTAVMGTVGTSAAYMAALGADRIYVREGTVTGSIGVILQTAEITDMLAKLGVEPITIKSSELKGVPSPLEPLTEDAREATRQVVLDLYEFFLDVVAERRPLDRNTVRRLADGRIFAGRQAVENGLVDAIGDEDDAVDWMVSARDVPGGLPVDTIDRRDDDSSLLEEIVGLSGKSLFSNALTLDGLVSLWQPAAR